MEDTYKGYEFFETDDGFWVTGPAGTDDHDDEITRLRTVAGVRRWIDSRIGGRASKAGSSRPTVRAVILLRGDGAEDFLPGHD